jgi:hypothetical protein
MDVSVSIGALFYHATIESRETILEITATSTKIIASRVLHVQYNVY